MRATCIVGVGMTRFGRFPERSLADLAAEAARGALADAGAAPALAQAIVFANATQGALEGQHGIRGQAALDGCGFGAAPVINVENACASATTALHLAHVLVGSGAYDCVLAAGAEKMVMPDPAKSMAAFEGSWDLSRRDATIAGLLAMGAGVRVPPGAEAEGPHSVFMDVYAAFCRHHMALFGTTQRQMAAVSAKNHQHSVENPRAQYRRAFTVEEVMAARPIVWPLTLPMCSPISDGAAAALVSTPEVAERLGQSGRAARIRASVLMSGDHRDPDRLEDHVARKAARRAWDAAGLGPEDVDVVECHDATAFGEILQSEMLGFFGLGEGGPAAERGDTRLGGRIPFNPSGGLESKGHPIGATGLGQVFEIVAQLRGEAGPRQIGDARIGLIENGGGLRGVEEAAVAITILEGAGR
ncbi:acetyl-CoA acetyltransferase [Roseiarcus fermentans]|uniref:Acetyl-CoA acetyltransferase n=1 Tax=Roseiarcus fermentans TaxID=1473586 RepID=A0A366FSN2_9HYPH|nr:thiolase family protein [Roseiarcus fermentans]RBP17628.1 acetyl-CoA acetyltransferase [Roseiarcus fermentans]